MIDSEPKSFLPPLDLGNNRLILSSSFGTKFVQNLESPDFSIQNSELNRQIIKFLSNKSGLGLLISKEAESQVADALRRVRVDPARIYGGKSESILEKLSQQCALPKGSTFTNVADRLIERNAIVLAFDFQYLDEANKKALMNDLKGLSKSALVIVTTESASDRILFDQPSSWWGRLSRKQTTTVLES